MKRFIITNLLIIIFTLSIQAQTCYDSTLNKIQNTLHSATWNTFALKMQKLKEHESTNVNIVHLGDSHIQGGYFTNVVRTDLGQSFGTSNRGWIFPYSLAHSNGPEDISIHSTSIWSGIKYNHNHSSALTCISGYALTTADSIIKLTIFLKNEGRILYPFSTIEIYHNSPLLSINSPQTPRITTDKINDDLFITKIQYHELHDSIPLVIHTHTKDSKLFSLAGINLKNKNAHLTYHAIGINGMAFSTFEKTIDYAPILGCLHPDCVVVSLGTNDAFMQVRDTAHLKQQLFSLIDHIRKINPDCCIILTTAGDHLRNKKTPNPALIRVNESIIVVAKATNCVYWDFFNIMGGLGSSIIWKKNGYLFHDFVHLSKDGYKFQGKLFSEALNKAIMQTRTHGMDK